jgi:hypothetical protein
MCYFAATETRRSGTDVVINEFNGSENQAMESNCWRRLKIADHDRNINVELEVLASNALPWPQAELVATAGAVSARETIYALWLSPQGKQSIL